MGGSVQFAVSYHAFKEGVVAAIGQSHQLLHVHVGLSIYVLAQVIWGTRRGSLPAVGVVALFAFLNECLDEAFWGSWRTVDTLTDVGLTLAWPVTLMLVSKLRRWRWDVRLARQRDAKALLSTHAAAVHYRKTAAIEYSRDLNPTV